ncbi:MAG: xanthine dehydrogenase family protein subunit M [Candidatus Riflebacteria bacterium]|nr:xanthine dehydrogenase family protein subunit M [Candidatus Riflebacteria bacterium]
MSDINFYKPTTIKEAVDLLQNQNYLAIAGGTDLVVKIRNGLFPGIRALVDLGALPLKTIKQENGKLIIGSGCTMSQIISDPLVKEYFPVLTKAASTVGAVQIRNAATIGGNIANASPAGDTIPALYSLEAVVIITGGQGQRQVPIDKFFTGPGKSVLRTGEIIEAFSLPLRKTSGSFLKLGERRAHAISKINMAVSTWNDGKNHFRVAMGSVAPTVLRCEKAEAVLEGAGLPLTEEILEQAAEIAMSTASPISDIRSTGSYRKRMAGVLAKRALKAL